MILDPKRHRQKFSVFQRLQLLNIIDINLLFNNSSFVVVQVPLVLLLLSHSDQLISFPN